MEVIILFLRKTYSLAKNAPIIEWQQMKYDTDNISNPKDFHVRYVNAELIGKRIEDEFKNEINIDWRFCNKIKNIVSSIFSLESGLTDIVVFVDKLHLGIRLMSHNGNQQKFFMASSIEDAKSIVR